MLIFVRSYSILLFGALVSLILSCNGGNKINVKKELNSWYGNKISLPNDSLIRNTRGKYLNPKYKTIKILTIINGDCSVCVDELKKWKELIKRVDTSKVGFIFSVYSSDNLRGFKLLDRLEIHFDYPYFIDKNKEFIIKNKFSENKLFQTLLLNNNNEVILVGNPTTNKTIHKLYFEEISKRSGNPKKKN